MSCCLVVRSGQYVRGNVVRSPRKGQHLCLPTLTSGAKRRCLETICVAVLMCSSHKPLVRTEPTKSTSAHVLVAQSQTHATRRTECNDSTHTETRVHASSVQKTTKRHDADKCVSSLQASMELSSCQKRPQRKWMARMYHDHHQRQQSMMRFHQSQLTTTNPRGPTFQSTMHWHLNPMRKIQLNVVHTRKRTNKSMHKRLRNGVCLSSHEQNFIAANTTTHRRVKSTNQDWRGYVQIKINNDTTG